MLVRWDHHFPPSLPRFEWLGSPVDPTRGDVEAIFAGAVRLLRGETIRSSTREGTLIEIVGTTVRVGDDVRTFDSSHDALVWAYSLIDDFNVAWSDFASEAA